METLDIINFLNYIQSLFQKINYIPHITVV